MLNRNDVLRDIESRMNSLPASDVCALFLLSVEKKEETGEALNLDSAAEQTANVLSRFFRITDIVGYLGKNRFTAFLTGRPTEGVIWEKAGTLTETLWIAAENAPEGSLSSYVGVYVFRADSDTYENIFNKAEYALEQARKSEIRNFYVYTTARTDAVYFRSPSDGVSSPLLMNYIDEGVRLFKVSDKIETIFVSPGYYRRIAIEEDEENAAHIQIHPADRDSFEADVLEAAKTGLQKESAYRISREGGDWVQCRTRLLRLAVRADHTVILEISHDTSGLENLKTQYDEKDQWLEFLSKSTDFLLWEVDVKTRTFRMIYTKDPIDHRLSVYPDFPDSLLECGRIHRDSAGQFREFAAEILNGKSEGNRNFIAQYRQTTAYGWISMSYKMLYDKDGRPEKAIGISEDLSYLPFHQARFMQRRGIPADLYSHLYCYMQANLTADYVEKLMLEGHEMIRLTRQRTYRETLVASGQRFFSAEDGNRFLQNFDRDRLLAEFDKGHRWFYDRCQLTDSEGNIQWISLGVNLCMDPESRDICLFAYMSNRNLQQRWETDVNYSPVDNPDSELYPVSTAKAILRNLLKEGDRTPCALAEISVFGLEDLIAHNSAVLPERRKMDIATALHTFLDTDCIIWKKSRDTLLVFFPDMVSQINLRRRIENAFSHTRISLGDFEEMKSLRFIAGVSCSSLGTADYARMKNAASTLCSVHTTEPSDAVFFANDDYSWNDKILDEMKSQSLVISAPSAPPPLCEEDKDVAMDCLSLMLVSDSKDNSLNSVLERLGHYYDADRVYILSLTENKQVITMLNEWCAPDKYSIQGNITGKLVSNFPVIARYAKNPGLLVLSKTEPAAKLTATASATPWQYMIFPLGQRDDTDFILCIENSKKHSDRLALIERLIPYLGQEERRFALRKHGVESMNRLYSLNNVHAYEKTVHMMSSDRFRSMGAMTVDIPDFAALKDREGYEYANSFLLKIADTLLNVFNSDLVFHVKEEEFIVLCTDTTYRVFLNLCARAKQLVGKRYNKLFRIGCTWSDGIFSGADLVNKAKSIMKSSTPSSLSIRDFYTKEDKWKETFIPGETRQPEATRRFTIYLQPKVDMRTGALVGAEALVRVMDEEGNLLPHGPIIGEMEKNGTIPQLDFFVFDRTLHTLSQWKEEDYPVKPISSNFSRNTLLNPTALASVLATLSRYPNVSPDMVEMEITETAGNVETSTFSELIQRFGDYGMHFSLDDFGSSYSNISMLSDLKFHSVKLDRSIVRNIASNSVTRMMIRDIAKICKSYNMLCVAEGVETQTQADILIEDGCFYAQGYYYGKPMPVEEFENKFFRSGN